MRTLNIAKDLDCSADGSAAAVDLSAKKVPFLPGYTAVVLVLLQAAADTVITIQGSDASDFSGTPEEYATVDLTGDSATTKAVLAEITATKRYIRVNNAEGTTGAGKVSADLLGN